MGLVADRNRGDDAPRGRIHDRQAVIKPIGHVGTSAVRAERHVGGLPAHGDLGQLAPGGDIDHADGRRAFASHVEFLAAWPDRQIERRLVSDLLGARGACAG